MKRLVIAITIFALTVSVCIYGFFAVNASGEKMIRAISEGINQARSGSGDLVEIAEKINKEWSNRSTLFKCVFVHDDFSEVEALLHKLRFFARQLSPDDFAECAEEAISRLQYTLDNEKPKIQNIF